MGLSKSVLITGMSGLIGNAVQKRLAGKYELSALNRRKVEGVKCRQADIKDLDSIMPAFKGIETVVHLAGVFKGKPTWKEFLDVNVTGTYNVFEASRIMGVKRIVYASSGAAVGGWEREPPYDAIVAGKYDSVPQDWPKLTEQTPTRASGIYGATKIWGEALGRFYADAYGISILCLRIGFVNSDDRPTEPRHYSIWCSQGDIARMVEKCIEAPTSLKYDILFVTSNNKWGIRELEHAKEAVGFVPEDSADRFSK